MAKRSEVALVIERLQTKRQRIAEDLNVVVECKEDGVEKVTARLQQEHAGVTSAIQLLEAERNGAKTDKPKRERKKKGAAATTQPEL